MWNAKDNLEINKWKDISCLWIIRFNNVKMTVCLKQSNESMQYLKYSKDTFTVAKNSKVYMETQKTPHS